MKSFSSGTVLVFCMLWVCFCHTPTDAAQANQQETSVLDTQPKTPQSSSLDELAEAYVRLGLTLGVVDANYVDAYYGPETWRPTPSTPKPSTTDLSAQAKELLSKLERSNTPSDSLQTARKTYLQKQLTAMIARCELLAGQTLSFEQEALRVYDATPPKHSEAHFQKLLAKLESLIPGTGSIQQRVGDYRNRFVIPPEKLDAVFKTALAEARRRTAKYIDLPPSETFEVAYVTDKPWSGYNWYKGEFKSLIQVNTSLPITIDRAIDLACHEGYPGHHVYNVLLEQHLVEGKGWQEFSFYPLFSPQSLIAEGTANYGIKAAFSLEERISFEEQVLFPAAGLDPTTARSYYQVMGILGQLKYAGNEAARGYLNGTMTSAEAINWLEKYALMSNAKAKQRISFFDTYRAYVINYNLGEDLVATFVANQMENNSEEARWAAFLKLLSSPLVPSMLTTH